MAAGAAAWVTVKTAATELGTTESRIRTAYRNGQLAVRDEVVAGRVRKVIDLDQARAWAGVPGPVADEPMATVIQMPTPERAPAPTPAPERAPVPTPTPAVAAPALSAEHELRIEALVEIAERALARSTRAESQVAFLRNELAQLRESHLRVQADVDRRNAEHFRAATRVACNDALARKSRGGGLFRLLVRRTSA